MENSNNSISNNSPSHFCTTDRTNFVTISENNLVVTYHGQGNHSHDVGAVRANAPFPHDNIIHYFEVKILSVGARRSIALGMANGDFSLNRYPGCEQGSYGYHGDDGRCYVDGGRGEPYGPRFGSDDVVGCGVHVEQGELFFTRNGRLLPPAASNVRGTLFAVVGLHSAGESVAINFGAQPFRFDLNEMIQEKKKTHQDRIARVKLNSSAVRNIVQCYLQHAGYEATLQALDGALPPDVRSTVASACTNNTITTKTTATSTTTTSTSTTNSSTSCKQSGNTERTLAASLGARSQLRTAIERGCIETEALPFLRQQWPALFECSWFGASLARLRCQSLIEMVRDGHIAEALSFARTELAPLRQTDVSWRTAVDQVAPLLAYPAPHQSPLSHLLAPTRRRRLADEINRCVIALEMNQTPADCMSSFELIVRHGRVAEQVRNSAVK